MTDTTMDEIREAYYARQRAAINEFLTSANDHRYAVGAIETTLTDEALAAAQQDLFDGVAKASDEVINYIRMIVAAQSLGLASQKGDHRRGVLIEG